MKLVTKVEVTRGQHGYIISMSNCFPSFIVRWILNFVGQSTHENWYPTNKSDITVCEEHQSMCCVWTFFTGFHIDFKGRCGLDHMVVEFTTTFAYHHWCCEFESRSGRGVQHYVIKVCQWLATGRWFSQDPLVSSTNKTDSHDIIKSPKQHLETFCFCSVSSSSSSSSSYYYYYYYYSPPFFLSMAHELAHGRSQELLDRISWNLVEL